MSTFVVKHFIFFIYLEKWLNIYTIGFGMSLGESLFYFRIVPFVFENKKNVTK